MTRQRDKTPRSDEAQKAFLAAYDEANLWANDSILQPLGHLMDLIKQKRLERDHAA